MMRRMLGTVPSHQKFMLQKLGRAAGLEIRATGPAARGDLRLVKFLTDQEISLALDVGANRGQFAEGLFAAGFAGKILSFEAMPSAQAEMAAKAERMGARWIAAPPLALSDQARAVAFNLNCADATSPLLQSSEQSLKTIPGLQLNSVIQVDTQPLDDFDAIYDFSRQRTFQKIDVQCGEGLVLSGAKATLEKVVGLVVEVSFVQIYAGQLLPMDILGDLSKLGFVLHDIVPAFRDPTFFQLLQVDVVFFRQSQCRSPKQS